MLKIRKSKDRGHFQHGWLDTYHTFSFADYYDPEFHGFRNLRVINEDRVIPANGFAKHAHQDMEIVTYIIEGELEHKDSMGSGSVIRRGDVQRMSAGTGVEHSEFNPSKTKGVHLLQIWIFPEKKSLKPEYEQKAFADSEKTNTLKLIVSQGGDKGSLKIHQDVKVYASVLLEGKKISQLFDERRFAWVQVVRGSLTCNGVSLEGGDGASLEQEGSLVLEALSDSEFLVFDLA